MEKLYKIFYGENENDYIRRFLKEEDIIDGYLSESKAFDLFFSDMVMCNDYLKHRFEHVDILIDCYDENDDVYIDEYQFFIIDFNFNYDENDIVKIIEKMENTLYYDNELDLYIMGITDLGTSRTLVPTNLIVKLEEKGDK